MVEKKNGWQKELNFDNNNAVKNFNQTSENIEKGEYFLKKNFREKYFLKENTLHPTKQSLSDNPYPEKIQSI